MAASWPPRPTAIDIASFAQMRRSWYVMLFQLAGGERFVADPAFIQQLWKLGSPRYAGEADAEEASRALQDGDGGATVVALYRSLFGQGPGSPVSPDRPTLYLHGEDDGCIGAELEKGLEGGLALAPQWR